MVKVLQLLGKKVSELHGDIAQAARYAALQAFRDGHVDVMVATGWLPIPTVCMNVHEFIVYLCRCMYVCM